MALRIITLLACGIAVSVVSSAAEGENWPQFRGPGHAGIAAKTARLPVEFGPSKGLLWRKPVPVGHSSPCIWGDQIFITGFDKDKGELIVIALHRNKGGAELWRRTVVPKQLENVHAVSNPATATIATDGQKVYAYFGSYGLLAYTIEGKHVWSTKIPVAQAAHGSPVSPTLVGDLIIIARDYPPNPELLAYSKSTGKLAWRFALEKRTGPQANTSHATVVLFKDHIVLHRPEELAGHSLQDGTRLWRVGLATGGISTPVVAADTVFVAAYTNFGEPGMNSALPDFPSLAARADADNDGKVSKAEAPTDLYVFKRPGVAESIPGTSMTIRDAFGFIDGNKDGSLDATEWVRIQDVVKTMTANRHGITAVQPNGSGDITLTAVRWSENRNVPEVPAPLYYRDRVYTIMNGGIFTCLDAQSGKVIYRGRIGAPGPYYAAPVAVDGKILLASGDGVVTVLGVGDELTVLSQTDLGEQIFATPAPIGTALYLRSVRTMWAFGKP